MTKEQKIASILAKLRELGTEELMYVSGATNALFLTQQINKEKNKETKSLRNAL